MKNKTYTNASLTAGSLIVVGLIVLSILYTQSKASPFPPSNVACFDVFMDSVEGGYAEPELNVPPFELKDISKFRCASKKGFEQYEIAGIDTTGHAFYVHHSAGGMAASGADSYLDHCYMRDGVLVKSVKLIGRSSEPQEGSCAFDESFPTDPESSYSFGAKF
ncbi:hypothetical protein K2Q08_03345 [Patescibacteria group bacterium]|nr:hypothetical protein [Patescibacteria group bacterium]